MNNTTTGWTTYQLNGTVVLKHHSGQWQLVFPHKTENKTNELHETKHHLYWHNT